MSLSRLWNPILSRSPKNSNSAVSARSFVLTALNRARYGFKSTSFGQQFQSGRAAIAPTLRERLLGPTTGKPFIYGTYALIGSSAVGIGLLAYYGLGLGKGDLSAMEKRALWPAHVRERIHSTYAYLAGSLTVTAASGMAAARSPLIMSLAGRGGLLAFAVTLAAIIGTGTLVRMVPYENTMAKHMAWLLHSGVMGAVLAPMCALGGPALLRAAWYTAGLVAGLSAVAVCAPSEKFLNMAGPLAMGFGVVFVSCIGTFFFPPHTALGASLTSIVVYGGLILFSMFLLYDTQRIMHMAERTPQHAGYSGYGYGQQQYPASNYFGEPSFGGHQMGRYDPINAQLSIYMDILNIFIRMAMIFGGQRRK